MKDSSWYGVEEEYLLPSFRVRDYADLTTTIISNDEYFYMKVGIIRRSALCAQQN